ncbi:MAG TPA: class I SAM-dependent methyltransferase [Candidatus Binatus sp.]|nr:class I SAM-dependent methyltransferase [Candidatus Binatus sp.]
MRDVTTVTRRHYDRFPYAFETALHAPLQLDGSLLGRAIREAAGPGKVVVDVGCGTGIVSRLVREYAPGSVVIGLDLSRESLRRAQGAERRVPLVQGDNLSLPVRTGAADLVISRGVIMTTREPRAALAELVRVLRAEGRLFVRVYSRAHPYRWVFRLAGPLCRAVAALPGGTALLAVTVFPVFLLFVELAFLLMRGRGTRIPVAVGWSLFADQLLTPHNSFHTAEEIIAWAATAGCHPVAHQTVTLGQQLEFLFVKDAGT